MYQILNINWKHKGKEKWCKITKKQNTKNKHTEKKK